MSEISLPDSFAAPGTLRDFVSPEGFLRENTYHRDDGNSLLQILEDPDLNQLVSFSPIVFSGPSGIGKTTAARHLISGLWLNHGLKDHDVAVISGADFYRTYALAVEMNSVADWRDRFMSAEVVLIDGLHQLADKPTAQLELRWLNDEFLDAAKLLVCTTLQTIDHYDSFDPSLTSRFAGGLAIPMTAPGINARREYLETISRDLNIMFMPDALERLASERCDLFPDLKSAAIQLNSICRGRKTAENTISLKTVNEFLKSDEHISPDLRLITETVAKYFKVRIADIKGPSRKQSIVRARSIAIYLVRTLTNANLELIGSFFGKRDHTTVLHAYRKIEKQLVDDQQTLIFVSDLNSLLNKQP